MQKGKEKLGELAVGETDFLDLEFESDDLWWTTVIKESETQNSCNNEQAVYKDKEKDGKKEPSVQTPKSVPFVVDPKLALPRANVTRIMRTILPEWVRISENIKQSVTESVHEFLAFITSEAVEISNARGAVIVTGEDILIAMERLDFGMYANALMVYLHNYREWKRAQTFTKNIHHLSSLQTGI